MKTLGNIAIESSSVLTSLTLSNGISFVTLTAPPTGIYILSFPPDLGSSGQVLTTNGSGQTYWAAAASVNYITSVDTNFQVNAGELSFSIAFDATLAAIEFNIDSLQFTVDTPTTGLVDIVKAPVTGLVDIVTAPVTGLVDIIKAPVTGLVDIVKAPVTGLVTVVTDLGNTVNDLVADVGLLDTIVTGLVPDVELLQLEVAAVTAATAANATTIATINGSQITITSSPFLSVTGSPATGASGAFTIGLGATALPTSNGGTGLTTIGY
jgi:hypothetical protein